MKKWIHASEELVVPGFTFNLGSKEIFLKSNSKNLTKRIIRDFINIVCDIKGVGDEIRRNSLYDEATLNDFRRRIMKANLEHHITDSDYEYYTIFGKDFSWNFPVEDFEKDVIVRDARE